MVLTAPGIEGLQYAPGQDLMLRVPLAGDKVVNRRYTIRSFDRRRAHGGRRRLPPRRRARELTGSPPPRPATASMPSGPAARSRSVRTPTGTSSWCDETGVPGALAMMEAIPAGSRGDRARSRSTAPATSRSRRRAAEIDSTCTGSTDPGRSVPGDADPVLEAVAAVDLPAGVGHVYVAAEAGVVRGVTRALAGRGLQPEQISGKAYWRRGLPNAEHGEPTKES